jgi:hypothetical protein
MSLKDKLDTRTTSLVSWACELDDGSEYIIPGAICYALLNRDQALINRQALSFSTLVTGRMNKSNHVYTPEELKYVELVANESFLADAFITKGPVEIVLCGMDLNVELPSQYLICAANQIRMMSEFPGTVDLFWKFYKHVPLNEALLFCQMFHPHLGNGDLSFSGFQSNHKYFDFHRMNKGHFQRMVNGKPDKNSKLKPFREVQRYTTLARYWSAEWSPHYMDNPPGKKEDRFWTGFDDREVFGDKEEVNAFGSKMKTFGLKLSFEEYCERLMKENTL